MKKKGIELLSAYSAAAKGPPDEVYVTDDSITLCWNNLGPLEFKPMKKGRKGRRKAQRTRHRR